MSSELTPDDIRHWDPSIITQLFGASAAMTVAHQALGDSLNSTAVCTQWDGVAGDAFRAAMVQTRADIDADAAESTRVGLAVQGAEDGVTFCRASILAIDDGAAVFGWTVGDDWQINTGGADLDDFEEEWRQSLQADLDDLKFRADATDTELAAAVRAAVGDAPLDLPGEPDQIQIPPPTTKPEDVKRWWDSLSQQQRDQLIAQHPPELGNLNGIDTISRDKINQAVMKDDINRVESAAARGHVPVEQVTQHPELYGLTPAAITRYNNAVQTGNGLKTNGTNPNGSKNPVFLQTYDPEAFAGRGREAIAIGNPDKADNTTVLVPGTGSSVRDGYLSHIDGRNIYNEALRADPNKADSVLVWMGYHAPDSAFDPQIGQTTLARDGGGLLAGDVNALGVTHQTGTSHVTVIGHSYGSTTVADAAAASGMHANDVVLVGCPGTDLAHSAADFHLSEGGHVYVGAASSDPISHFGGIQEHMPGTGVTIGLGDDPAVEGYGSTRFKAEAPGLTFPLKDHSSYFTPGDESLFSIADIASGHGDALAHDNMTAEHRGTYWLPDEFDPESLRLPTAGHYH